MNKELKSWLHELKTDSEVFSPTVTADAEPVAVVRRAHYGGRAANIGVQVVNLLPGANVMDGTKLYAAPALSASADGGAVKDAARDVLAERRRQVEQEGWTPEHDDMHNGGVLAVSGACYALESASILCSDESAYWARMFAGARRNLWQFDEEWWKPGTSRRMLVKAAALILAEIERIDRSNSATAGDSTKDQP